MFQKEVGEKIICNYPSVNYGRLSILSNFKLNFIKNLTFPLIVFTQNQK